MGFASSWLVSQVGGHLLGPIILGDGGGITHNDPKCLQGRSSGVQCIISAYIELSSNET